MKKYFLFKIVAIKHKVISLFYPFIKHFVGIKSDKIKQSVISEYGKKYNCSVLVETGTYLGDMVFAQKPNFELIYSIEVGKDLFENAVSRFSKDEHITILFGDSGIVLDKLVPSLETRSIFWLDGHFSGGISSKGDSDCPIIKELECILKNNANNHVILIDDARLFNGEGDYPTIDYIEKTFAQFAPNYSMEVKDDIMRFSS